MTSPINIDRDGDAGSLSKPQDSQLLSDRWTEEALRLHRRYQEEIVEGCGLCPWAARAVVRVRVLHQVDLNVTPTLTTISELSKDEDAEVALLIFPRLQEARLPFERFVASVRESDARRHPLGEIPFVMAPFHPNAAPDMTEPERLIPFLRRSPDPSIQLLRSSVLDRIRSGIPQGTQFMDATKLAAEFLTAPPIPLRERIARTNLATVEKMGVREMAARLDSIIHDRQESYRALAAEAEREAAAPR
jgi:hypothetical protein